MMKNLLIGTASAALLITAGAASAADYKGNGNQWTATVGGFFNVGAGFADLADGTDGMAAIRDSEIHFKFEMVADNGLTFGAKVELEVGDGSQASVLSWNDANNNNTVDAGEISKSKSGHFASIDEAYMYVSGSFGRIEVGEADGAADAMDRNGLVTPDWASAQNGGGFVFDYYGGATSTGFNFGYAYGYDTSDNIKVSYFTPNFSGFEAGVSWVLAPAADGNVAPLGTEDDSLEIGAKYTGDFDGFGLKIGAGYTTDFDDSQMALGTVGISTGGFSFGVMYGWKDSKKIDGQHNVGAGIAYETGPWKFGLDGAVVTGGSGKGDWGLATGVSYDLAPGVEVGLTGEYAHDDQKSAGADDNSWAIGTWMGLSF